jgi:hypothetical protein
MHKFGMLWQRQGWHCAPYKVNSGPVIYGTLIT